MSDKEILDEIETSWMSEGHLVKIDREHFDWLIEQSQKVEQLQQEIMRLSHENIDLQRHISRQETDIWNLEMANGQFKKLANLIIEESRWGNVETALEKVVSIAKRIVEGTE